MSKNQFEELINQGYIVSDEFSSIGNEMKVEEEKLKEKGDFKGTYTDQIDKEVADYLGRDQFNFNPNNSSTYQQLRNQYLGDGKKAMQDTLASGALLTGGNNNSAAQVAAQQVYNDYAKGVTDAIPTLEAQAYERYLNEGNKMLQNIELLKSLDDTEYSRELDEINQIYSMLNYLTGKQSNVAALDASKNSYNQGLAGMLQNAYMHDENMAFSEKQADIAQKNVEWEQGQSKLQSELNALLNFASMGVPVTVTPELEAAGFTQAMFDSLTVKANTPTGGGKNDDDTEIQQATVENYEKFKNNFLDNADLYGWEYAYNTAIDEAITYNLSEEQLNGILYNDYFRNQYLAEYNKNHAKDDTPSIDTDLMAAIKKYKKDNN